MDKQDELLILRRELRRVKEDLVSQSTFLHYLLHRLGGSITINKDAALDVYRDFDINYRTDTAVAEHVLIYLKPNPGRP